MDGPAFALLFAVLILAILAVAFVGARLARRPRAAPPEEAPFEEAEPETEVVEAPPVEEPEAEAVEGPPVEEPAAEAVEAPVIEAPVIEAPPVEVPPVEAPVIEAPPVEVPPVEPPAVGPVAPDPVEAPAPEAPPEAPVAEPPEAPAVAPPRGRIRSIGASIARVLRRPSLAAEDWVELEEILLLADVGVAATERIVSSLRARRELGDPLAALRDELVAVLGDADRTLARKTDDLTVWLVTGVNGSGKTTTIGKLAAQERARGASVVLAAADTFRAAADQQLEIWAERAGAEVVKHRPGSDPAAVVFDGIAAAHSRNADLLIVDTAGRLQTRRNLMEELAKIRRVLEREAGDPDEVLLVLDATTGQNALQQARAFMEAVSLTGIALTKLDGTAKGGIVIGVQQELGIPVKLVGLGEGVGDLAPFDPRTFVDDLLTTIE